ncbi:MAG TPA: hypothetical protein VGY58_13970 [Gemmataceae bacterium]|nr:hypothetical protein [Gemmataceae bacterium]
MNALTNEKVGNYLNDHFVSSFQKVGTFRVVNGQKQGGNVASYFCLPDGTILHIVTGPVDAETLLREARWVVDNRKLAVTLSRGSYAKYRSFFRKAHTERLHQEYRLDIDPQQLADESPVLPVSGPTFAALRQQKGVSSQALAHLLLAAFPLAKVDQAYRVVFESILGEKVSTLPVVMK